MKKLGILTIMLAIVFCGTYYQKYEYQRELSLREYELVIAMRPVEIREYFWNKDLAEREKEVTGYLLAMNLR